MYLMNALSLLNELGNALVDKIIRWLKTSAGVLEYARSTAEQMLQRLIRANDRTVFFLGGLNKFFGIDIVDR